MTKEQEALKTLARLGQEIEAQPEQEPVLWGVMTPTGKFSPYAYWSKKDAERIAAVSHVGGKAAPLYADASQRPWVGLTEAEVFECENAVPDEVISDRNWCVYFAHNIEAKLKEKNT